MKIRDRIEKVKCGLVIDTYKSGTKGVDLKAAATKALLGGMPDDDDTNNVTDWAKYMSIFADNPSQLARLKGRDNHATYVKEMCAYLVANGTCGGGTPHNLAQGVDESIDDGGLDFKTDPNFKRHIEFPPIP